LAIPVGFLIVVLGRQQLFTENTLTPVLPVLWSALNHARVVAGNARETRNSEPPASAK
jgi:formate/nitrite transporter FocA (FNT family)